MQRLSPRYKYALTIAYDGTAYNGWQIQPNALSIQEVLETELRKITQENVKVIGAGRTDAGVHATGQIAHFCTSKEIDIPKTFASLNSLLPKDIRILELSQAPLSFHAQKSAVRKIYRYHLSLNKVQNPFRRLYSLHIKGKFDLDLVCQAKEMLVGTHDFTSFTNEAHKGAAAKNAIRTIYRIDCIPEPGGCYFEFEGNGFLYMMVRNMMGLLLEIGAHKRAIEEIPDILDAKDRRKAGIAAPAYPLFLHQVIY